MFFKYLKNFLNFFLKYFLNILPKEFSQKEFLFGKLFPKLEKKSPKRKRKILLSRIKIIIKILTPTQNNRNILHLPLGGQQFSVTEIIEKASARKVEWSGCKNQIDLKVSQLLLSCSVSDNFFLLLLFIVL